MNTDPLALAAALILASIAVARAARLVIHDDWPPTAALRRWWFNQTVAKGGWRARWAPVLVGHDGGSGCPFCFAPYAAAVDLVWWVWSGGTWDGGWGSAWWLVNAWAAVSYAAAMLVVRDEPPEQE